jgi:hypothetical protein
MTKKSLLITLILICVGVILLHRPVLRAAGEFMAPNGSEEAEVLIVEGTQVVRKDAINAGIRLLSDGKVKHMLVVVLHEMSKGDQLFAIQDKYAQLLISESEKLGLERGKFQVIVTPIRGHPITLTEARFVMARLSQEGVKSAILLSEGFHTRRSLGVYSQEGARAGIRISPHPYFAEYRLDDWWTRPEGIHAFFVESVKLAYYLMRGYLSVKFL